MIPPDAPIAIYIASLMPSATNNSPHLAPIGPVKRIKAAPETIQSADNIIIPDKR